jgi:hypothetical protein
LFLLYQMLVVTTRVPTYYVVYEWSLTMEIDGQDCLWSVNFWKHFKSKFLWKKFKKKTIFCEICFLILSDGAVNSGRLMVCGDMDENRLIRPFERASYFWKWGIYSQILHSHHEKKNCLIICASHKKKKKKKIN